MNPNDYLTAAQSHIERNGAKLTDLRRLVLQLLLPYPGVVKAYQVLNDLQQIRPGAAPPTVYRALDFWVEQGVVHRVEAHNGFVVCQHLQARHPSILLLCSCCGAVAELAADEVLEEVRSACDAAGYTLTTQQLVVQGQCGQCGSDTVACTNARHKHSHGAATMMGVGHA